jgi:hypothetical protein
MASDFWLAACACLSVCSSDNNLNEDYYTYDSVYEMREEKIYDQMMSRSHKKTPFEQPVSFCFCLCMSRDTNYCSFLTN